jgi:hypothetical protein
VDSTVNTLVNTTPSATFPLLIKTEDHHSKDYEGKIFLFLYWAICPKMTANLFEVKSDY